MITFRDVSGERKIQEEIRNLLFHDQLTKVYNRSYFEEILRTFDTPNQLPISIIVGDINGLKFVNDSFGNDAGDAFLQQIAQILKTTCREKDIIARWGGDSFIILLPQTSERTAKNICNRINTTVKNMKNNPLNLNIGLGTATKTGSDQPIYGVIKQAEDNMYHRKLLEQESSLNSIISSLEKTLAAKSHETEEHARRMRKMALFLGNLLQLSTRSLNELVLLSALHDLGKVAISEEILTKPGPLTEEEFEKIKEHPEVGYRIASSVPELASIAEAIRSHHEWWDGSGYPRGLKGEEIPLLARILAIADAYDVMTNGRPYKEAVSPKEALEEIKRCAGTQFDPHLVKILLAGLDEAATVIENDHSDREEV